MASSVVVMNKISVARRTVADGLALMPSNDFQQFRIRAHEVADIFAHGAAAVGLFLLFYHSLGEIFTGLDGDGPSPKHRCC